MMPPKMPTLFHAQGLYANLVVVSAVRRRPPLGSNLPPKDCKDLLNLLDSLVPEGRRRTQA